jgi:6-phosphofructokinase 1
LTSYAKNIKYEITIKYIDPTYIIRAVPTNAFDTHYCARLANSAVHSAFAGFTNFTTGVINRQGVIIPLDYLNSLGTRKINPTTDSNYLYMLGSTGQPKFINRK